MPKKFQIIELKLLPNIPFNKQIPAIRESIYKTTCPYCGKIKRFRPYENITQCNCKTKFKLKIGDITKKGIVLEILSSPMRYRTQCQTCNNIGIFNHSSSQNRNCKCRKSKNYIHKIVIADIPITEQIPDKRTKTYITTCSNCGKKKRVIKSAKIRKCICLQTPKFNIGDISNSGEIVGILDSPKRYEVKCPKCGTIKVRTYNNCRIKQQCRNCFIINKKQNSKYKVGNIIGTNKILSTSKNGKNIKFTVLCINCNKIRTISTTTPKKGLKKQCRSCYSEKITTHKIGNEHAHFTVIKIFYRSTSKRYVLVQCKKCNNYRTGRLSSLIKHKCNKCISKENGVVIKGEIYGDYTIIDRISVSHTLIKHNCGNIFIRSFKHIKDIVCRECYPPRMKTKKILGTEEEYALVMNKLENKGDLE